MRSRLMPHVQPHEPFSAIDQPWERTLHQKPQSLNPVVPQNERAETRQVTEPPITSNNLKTAQNPVSQTQPDPRVSNHIPITDHLSNSVPRKRKHPARHTEPIAHQPSAAAQTARVVGGSRGRLHPNHVGARLARWAAAAPKSPPPSKPSRRGLGLGGLGLALIFSHPPRASSFSAAPRATDSGISSSSHAQHRAHGNHGGAQFFLFPRGSKLLGRFPNPGAPPTPTPTQRPGDGER